MLQFYVPPGIGDISWIYSKVAEVAEKRKVAFLLCNNPPRRGKPFVDLLPNIVNLGYGRRPYHEVKDSRLPTYTDLASLRSGSYILSLNPHLESGKHLTTAFPKQQTRYHYKPLLAPLRQHKKAYALSQDARIKIGLYCSSYSHRSDTLFWEVPQWLSFCKKVRERYPAALWVIIGADYDDRTRDVAQLLRKAGFATCYCVSQPIGQTLNIIRQLDYFFAFPSGLGIMADVLNIPCMMWFWGNLPGWEHHSGLFGAYADPENVQSGRHITAPYEEPEASFKLFMNKGERFIRDE